MPGSNITFVEPFPPRTESTPPHSTSFFNDGDVDAALQEALQKEGIEVYQAYYFRDWNYDADKNLVRSIKYVCSIQGERFCGFPSSIAEQLDKAKHGKARNER